MTLVTVKEVEREKQRSASGVVVGHLTLNLHFF
jgi:hypothetical protein